MVGDRNIGSEYFEEWAGADVLVEGTASPPTITHIMLPLPLHGNQSPKQNPKLPPACWCCALHANSRATAAVLPVWTAGCVQKHLSSKRMLLELELGLHLQAAAALQTSFIEDLPPFLLPVR